MRIAQINVTSELSTGRIATELCRQAMKRGHQALLCHARGLSPSDVPSLVIGSRLDTCIHAALARLTDRSGFFSRRATRRLVAQLKQYQPDLIHLHNLHGYYLHLPTLFNYLRKADIAVLWTLHDCWSFTGHCATMALDDSCNKSGESCERWQSGCGHCPLRGYYPKSLFIDQSARNYQEKRKLFTNIPTMALATPSQWLKGEVARSFLRDYPVYVLPNGVDLAVFKPCENASALQSTLALYRLDTLIGRKLVLSAASAWDGRKGLSDLIRLAKVLGRGYQVVAVGLSEKQIASLPPDTVLGLPRTQNLNELCALYTACDLYISLSQQETMGMTLLEALSCGTQVLCYNATAMPEIVTEKVGAVVPLGDIAAAAQAVKQLCAAPKSAADCIARAREYASEARFAAYIERYEAMGGECPAQPQDREDAK